MKVLSRILEGTGLVTALVGGCILDSPGVWFYIAAGLWFGGLVIAGIGIAIGIAAEDWEERERRKRIERKIKRNSMFLHWAGDCDIAYLGDTDRGHLSDRRCRQSRI